jgi:hypothetical protein
MLTITGHKGNANLNHTKIPLQLECLDTTNNKSWLECGEMEPSYSAGGNVR